MQALAIDNQLKKSYLTINQKEPFF